MEDEIIQTGWCCRQCDTQMNLEGDEGPVILQSGTKVCCECCSSDLAELY